MNVLERILTVFWSFVELVRTILEQFSGSFFGFCREIFEYFFENCLEQFRRFKKISEFLKKKFWIFRETFGTFAENL